MDYRGYFRPNEAGHERVMEGKDISGNYEWFELYINPYSETELHINLNPATIEEFESIFGNRESRVRIEFHPITYENIQNFIYENNLNNVI